MNAQKRLQTSLDRVPYGDPTLSNDLKVNKKLPDGIKSHELYTDILRIAWPSFIELLLTQLTSMVDMMMVGSIGGTENPILGVQALSAVGLTAQPKFLLAVTFIAMNTGVTALVARHKGNGNKEQANLVVRQGLLFTFIVAFLFSIVGFIFARRMVLFMGSTEETVTQLGTYYLRIQMCGFLPLALTSTITAVLRAVGDSKTCMVYNLVANLMNVIFNWILIYGNLGFPELGVVGASIATVLGQIIAFCMASFAIIRGNSFLKLEFRLGFRPHKATLQSMTHIGFPAMIEQLLMSMGAIIFAKAIASLGTTAYSTHQICMNIQSLSFMTGQAFAVSATTLVGQSLGKRRPDMAQAYGNRARTLGFFSSVIIVFVFIFFGRNIISLYNSDATIIETGTKILLFMAFMQPFQTSQFIITGGLRGAGDTKTTAAITCITVLLMRPSLAILFIKAGLGLYGAWLAFASDQLVRSFLVLLRYNSGKWKTIQVQPKS